MTPPDAFPLALPDACTLPMAEQPLRVAAFDQLLGTHLLAADRLDPRRLRLRLAAGPEVAAATAELAAREVRCCAFFTFTLTVGSGELTLEVAVPEQHRAVLAALADRAETAL